VLLAVHLGLLIAPWLLLSSLPALPVQLTSPASRPELVTKAPQEVHDIANMGMLRSAPWRTVPWADYPLLFVWTLAWAVSVQLVLRIGQHNALWQLPAGRHVLRNPQAGAPGCVDTLRGLVPSSLVWAVELYVASIGYVAHRCHLIGGVTGELPLLLAALGWAGWPLLIPLAFHMSELYLVSGPASLLLLVVASDLIRQNWREEPAYRAHLQQSKERRTAAAEDRWRGFQRRQRANQEELHQKLGARLERMAERQHEDELAAAARKPTVAPSAHQHSPNVATHAVPTATAGGGTSIGREAIAGRRSTRASDAALIGRRARVVWSREHKGAADGGSKWRGVWVPLDESISSRLEEALRRGHAAVPLDEDDGSYVDLTVLWQAPTELHSDAEVRRISTASDSESDDFISAMRALPSAGEEMTWIVRSNLPSEAHFGLRTHDEAGTFWEGARPRRYVQRSVAAGSAAAASAGPSADDSGVSGTAVGEVNVTSRSSILNPLRWLAGRFPA